MPEKIIAQAADDLHLAVEELDDLIKGYNRRQNIKAAALLVLMIVFGYIALQADQASRESTRASDRATEAVTNAETALLEALKVDCRQTNSNRIDRQAQLDARVNTPVFDVTAPPEYELLDPSVRAYVDYLGQYLQSEHEKDVAEAEAFRRDFPLLNCENVTLPDPEPTG